jgi:hypothetical protein
MKRVCAWCNRELVGDTALPGEKYVGRPGGASHGCCVECRRTVMEKDLSDWRNRKDVSEVRQWLG